MKNKIVIQPNIGIYINDIPILLRENKDNLFSIISKAEIKSLGINNEWSIVYKSINFSKLVVDCICIVVKRSL